jgi:metal-responsive CopG/Arc/MetJ family transcriptional regulator
MRISVVVPDELAEQMDRYKSEEGATTSGVVREALVSYLKERRRRTAGEALKRAARAAPLPPGEARRLLKELEAERRQADRP